MFFHPLPLSDKYFLAMTGNSIYLLDVFDNMLCLKKADKDGGYCEPLPLRKTKRPPVQPGRVDIKSKIATMLDVIGAYGDKRNGYKLSGSAAFVYDKPIFRCCASPGSAQLGRFVPRQPTASSAPRVTTSAGKCCRRPASPSACSPRP